MENYLETSGVDQVGGFTGETLAVHGPRDRRVPDVIAVPLVGWLRAGHGAAVRAAGVIPGVLDGLLMMILVAGAAVYAIFIGRTAFRAHGGLRWTLVDDAMVSMRYAQHLAQGYGLVWNPGQAPVEKLQTATVDVQGFRGGWCRHAVVPVSNH